MVLLVRGLLDALLLELPPPILPKSLEVWKLFLFHLGLVNWVLPFQSASVLPSTMCQQMVSTESVGTVLSKAPAVKVLWQRNHAKK